MHSSTCPPKVVTFFANTSHDTSPVHRKFGNREIMHNSGGLRYEEASGAAWEGGRGALVGAAKVCSFGRRGSMLKEF